jgi:hypothetical protein
MPITRSELEQLIRGIGPVIKDHVQSEIEKRCGALRSDIKELQERTPIEWVETWSNATKYRKAQLVTWDGSAWIATKDNIGREPGKTSDGSWRLFASRGKQGSQGPPGKDAR